jgi:hypothetical protein
MPIFKYHHGQSNVPGAMLRTAQRVQRDGHYESGLYPVSATTLVAAALYPRALRLSSHGERLQPNDLHEHARSAGIDL